MKEKCGVVGISSEESFKKIYYSLLSLQHRGQESCGIAMANGDEIKINCKKYMGLVSRLADESMDGRVGIGHVRYSTTGESALINAQPLVLSCSYGDLAVAHNGNITNYPELKKEFSSRGHSFYTDTDSEIILKELAYNLELKGENAIVDMMNKLQGAYSLTLLINDRLYAIRDPSAIRPLCIGKLDDGYAVSSESVGLDTVGAKFLRDVRGGEVIKIVDGEISSLEIFNRTPKHCVFEYIYFARADSVIDSVSVYDTRLRLGRRLSEEHPVDGDIVCPVPDSGRTATLGYSMATGIEFSEGLMKNRYIGRTFIQPEGLRKEDIKVKLNPVKSQICNKKVILIDDSIVRGNTMRRIVSLLKSAGAREVHVRIASPPIRYPCPFGIDMQTRDQFIANGKSIEDIAREIGCDSLGYLSIEGLIDGIGLPEDNLCLGCLKDGGQKKL